MSKNWNKDKLIFEEKCKQVLAASKQEAEVNTSKMLTND